MLSNRRRARMAQKKIDLELHRDGVEHGYTICQNAQGDFAKGPESTGSHNNVNIDVQCPAGYHPTGLFHTHPHGTTDPSPADIRAARKFGLRHLCIGVPETGEVSCHDVCLRCRD